MIGVGLKENRSREIEESEYRLFKKICCKGKARIGSNWRERDPRWCCLIFIFRMRLIYSNLVDL